MNRFLCGRRRCDGLAADMDSDDSPIREEMRLAGVLRATAEELGGGRFSVRFRQAAARLERGERLDDALARARIPGPVRELVGAAVAFGEPAAVMQEFIEMHHAQRDIRRRDLTILAYPTVVLIIIVAIAVVFAFFVAPQFHDIYSDIRGDSHPCLPIFTKTSLLLMVTVMPRVSGSLVLVAMCAAVVWMIPLPAWLERLTYRIPWVGDVLRDRRLLPWLRLVAVQLEQNQSLPESLRRAGRLGRSRHLARMTGRLARGVEHGEPLDVLMAREPSVPATIVPAVRWGIEHERMGAAFRSAEQALAGPLRSHGECPYAFLLPLALFPVMFVVAFIVVSLFLPMISIICLS